MKPTLTTLKQVIFEIFGDMFFMFPEQYEPDEKVLFPENWLKYRIEIRQADTRFLNCYFTKEQAAQMAENFLGASADEISEVIISETLKEAVNVIGGNLLNQLEDDYHLGIPEPCRAEPAALLKEACQRHEALLLNVEEHPFLARITLD